MPIPASPLLPPFETVSWSPDGVSLRLLDQRRLPLEETYFDVHTLDELVGAIRSLAVRGAPAIGVAAAMGLAAVFAHEAHTRATLSSDPAAARNSPCARVAALAAVIETARPTAVNLRWALQRMLLCAEQVGDDASPAALVSVLREEATCIRDEDRAMCHAIGQFGAPLIQPGAQLLTHCNAGALAATGIGTALAPMYVAQARGVTFRVFADETRPLLQGARLTSWELQRAGIDVTVLPDGAAASLLASGRINAVFVGADRIAANGDVANKIGTYALALAAREHGVPFHVCAPGSTFDANTPTGAGIEIEHRDRDELAFSGATQILPQHVAAYNPAFDITPRALITHYVTDRGLLEPPFTT